jgi:hypothetical protein
MRQAPLALISLTVVGVLLLVQPSAPTRAAPGEQLDDNIVVQINSPTSGQQVQGRIVIRGYAADRRSTEGSGLNERDIQLYLNDTSTERNRLDYATFGQHSPAAATDLGPSLAGTGFTRTWETCGFPPGQYQLFAWVSSLVVQGARNVASVPLEIMPCSPASAIHEDNFASGGGRILQAGTTRPLESASPGVHTIRLEQRGAAQWGPPAVVADFAAGIDARCTRADVDCRYGLNFRRDSGPGRADTDSLYSFSVDPVQQRILFAYWPPGEGANRVVRLIPWTASTDVRGGSETNRLAVVAQGDWLRLFVNGRQVGEQHHDQRPWGAINWFAATDARDQTVEVQFRNLVVTTVGPIDALRAVLGGS